jgi:hypothetical protein
MFTTGGNREVLASFIRFNQFATSFNALHANPCW